MTWANIDPDLCQHMASLGLQLVDSSFPGQNGCNFADDIFKYIFVNEIFCILIKIVMKFIPIDNNPKLVQIMAWGHTGDMTLSEPMLARFSDAYMRHQGEMS